MTHRNTETPAEREFRESFARLARTMLERGREIGIFDTPATPEPAAPAVTPSEERASELQARHDRIRGYLLDQDCTPAERHTIIASPIPLTADIPGVCSFIDNDGQTIYTLLISTMGELVEWVYVTPEPATPEYSFDLDEERERGWYADDIDITPAHTRVTADDIQSICDIDIAYSRADDDYLARLAEHNALLSPEKRADISSYPYGWYSQDTPEPHTETPAEPIDWSFI